MYKFHRFFTAFLISLCCVLTVSADINPMYQTSPEFFATPLAREVGENILLYQRVTGGWPKNIDMSRKLSEDERAKVLADKQRTDDSTTDNHATNLQMEFLARLYKATGDKRYRDAIAQAVEFLLAGQYDNGGWPQFWPDPQGYQIHITYNDGAMTNTLNTLRAVADKKPPYDSDIVSKDTRKRIRTAFNKGIECILATQIVKDGQLTVWCQQHDRETFLPAPARAYELPCFCSSESAEIVRLLMSLDNPDESVKKAVHAAMKWIDTYKLTGLRKVRTGRKYSYDQDLKLVEDPDANTPLWARYYDLDECRPFVCDRDGIMRRRLEDIGVERRCGYSWFNDSALDLYDRYNEWADKWCPEEKLQLSLQTPGANELGIISLYEKPKINPELFDYIVNPGESIQSAIEAAPEDPKVQFKILVRNGVYNQKVIIDRPNIVLVGENRDSTFIIRPETAEYNDIREYRGKEVGMGVVYLLEGADDCLISGFTIYNNYGSTIEPTTTHQMAVFGRATRTIIVNCNIKSDGNDALALWARGGNGMYYHADLNLECPGVDFLCPRGWCYATRCNFIGDSRAIIWHDGSGDKSKKLVITNSFFDAKSPTKLGRWHHDSQFYLINCKMTANILDSNISYAYSDKVLDPCPWGQRVYYYGCSRENGHSGWLNDNLDQSEDAEAFHGINPKWTFGGRWDPEKVLRALWPVINY